ncbi:hypothetical protein [Streptomyces sp. 7N604]|uniref:hypothetical protein n=1 Tax=Streptomyces sp. 7N604 TaxID=3457415 RepID=UPI003FD3927A
MIAQEPQHPRTIPVVPSAPGGADKSVFEDVRVLGLDGQASAERWMPVLLDILVPAPNPRDSNPR